MKRKLSLKSADVEDEILSCNICFEKFAGTGDKSARNLNCGHTYCLKCLNVICGGQNRVECPCCRLPTKFSRGLGPSSLPISFQFVRLLEIAESSIRSREEILATACVGQELDLSVTPMCMNCEDDAPCAAEWGCQDCSASWCTDCKVAHLNQKVFKHHRMLSLQDYSRQQTNRCTKHPNEEIKCVCDECGVLVCCMGVSLSHADHKISALHEAITRERSKLEEATRKAQQLMTRVQPKVEQAKQRLVEYREESANMHEQIDTESSKLAELLSRRTAAAHEEVEARMGGAIRLVEAEKDALEAWLSRASNCMESVGHTMGADKGVASFATCQETHSTLTALIQQQAAGESSTGSSSRNFSVTGGGGIGGLAAGGLVSSSRVVATTRGLRLSLDLDAAGKIRSLVDTLFAVQEEAGAGPAGVYPLTRREGGIVGSAASLSDARGLALRAAAPGSGQPSLLFVCDTSKHQVQIFDANSGAFIRSIGSGVKGAGAGQLSRPSNVVTRLLPSGQSLLYVSETGNGRIEVFDSDSGTHVRMLGVGELQDPQCLALLEQPVALQLPTLLFVASYGQSTVKVLNADTGSLVRTIGTGTDGAGIGELNEPRGIAVRKAPPGSTSHWLLYVSECWNHRIQVFDADTGAHVRMIGAGVVGAGLGQLQYPWGIALQESASGSGAPCLLYVADWYNHRVQVFDADTGAHVRMISADRGNAVGQLERPVGVILHPGPDGKMLMFVSQSAGQVQVLEV